MGTRKGTSQGGPSVIGFYQGVVNKRSETVKGSCINGYAMCFVILCITEPQKKIINVTNRYISYVLFNPAERKCMVHVFGKHCATILGFE